LGILTEVPASKGDVPRKIGKRSKKKPTRKKVSVRHARRGVRITKETHAYNSSALEIALSSRQKEEHAQGKKKGQRRRAPSGIYMTTAGRSGGSQGERGVQEGNGLYRNPEGMSDLDDARKADFGGKTFQKTTSGS